MKLRLVFFALTVMASTVAAQPEDADLSFITKPTIDILISRLTSSDQQAVNEWLNLDQNSAVLNKNALEGMSTGAFPANAQAIKLAPPQMAIEYLLNAGLPSSVLATPDSSADYLDQIFSVVSEADANQLNLYFQALPRQKELFLSIASSQPTPWHALELIGYPMSEEMEKLVASEKLAATAEKYGKLFEISKLETFCDSLAGLPKEFGSLVSISSIATEGLSSGFLIAAEEEYYGTLWGMIDDSEKARLGANSPEMKFQGGHLQGLSFALNNVSSEQMRNDANNMVRNVSNALGGLGGIKPFGKNRRSKKEQREFGDTCTLYAGTYLEELGL